jgi:hypothetical protein
MIQLAGFIFAVGFSSPVIKGGIDPHLTFFSDEAWFKFRDT